jgi:uncharacterized protein YggE
MKRIRMLLVLAAFASLAQAQTATQPPRDAATPETVSVTGTGHATLVPDRFTFTVGVQTQAPTVEEAVNANNAKIAAAVAALKKAGATDAEVRTAGFSIYPQQDYSQGQMPRLLGYQVSNSVTVTKKQIGEAGRLLQVAIAAGVNTAGGIQFEVSDPTRGRDQGLKAAFDDARAKAALLASAAGRTLGRAIAITEGTGAGEVVRPMMARGAVMAQAKMEVSDVPVESGTQELTFTISAVFEMR